MSIIGTLSISGPIALLAKIATELEARFPDGLYATVEVSEFGGWNIEKATILMRRLGRKQYMLVKLIVESGYVSTENIKISVGEMRGLVGPLSKHISSMAGEWVVDEDIIPIIETAFGTDEANKYQATGMRMRSELIPIFRAAIEATGNR